MTGQHPIHEIEIPDAEQRRQVLLGLRHALRQYGQVNAHLDNLVDKARELGLVEAVKHVEEIRKAA